MKTKLSNVIHTNIQSSITPFNIFISFLIIITTITLLYIYQQHYKHNTNTNTNTPYLEHFNSITTNSTNSTNSNITTTTQPILDSSKNITQFDNIAIEDISIKNNVIQVLKDLQTGLLRFSNLDAPIIINDNGQTCAPWGNYNNGKYNINDNNCIILENTSTARKCLSASGELATCNNLYNDGYINKMNNIDIQPLIHNTLTHITQNIGNTNTDLHNKSTTIDVLINDLITKRNLEIQQQYFITYNTDNLVEKKNNMNTINKEVSDKQTEVNLNQVSFSQFLADNTSKENLTNIYYKITIGLVITIIIIGILNILFSNIL